MQLCHSTDALVVDGNSDLARAGSLDMQRTVEAYGKRAWLSRHIRAISVCSRHLAQSLEDATEVLGQGRLEHQRRTADRVRERQGRGVEGLPRTGGQDVAGFARGRPTAPP